MINSYVFFNRWYNTNCTTIEVVKNYYEYDLDRDINFKGDIRKTSLQTAYEKGSIVVVQYLCKSGVDINAKT